VTGSATALCAALVITDPKRSYMLHGYDHGWKQQHGYEPQNLILSATAGLNEHNISV